MVEKPRRRRYRDYELLRAAMGGVNEAAANQNASRDSTTKEVVTSGDERPVARASITISE